VVDALIQLFSEVLDLPVHELNDETSPDNASRWDSLAAMHLVVAIESLFNVTLSTKEIMRMSKIGSVRQVLQEKNVNV
jgi:acyl carrier protein